MSATRDLAALRAMTSDLNDYLLAQVMFWPLSGPSDWPKLSLGSYLLTRQRLTVEPALASEVDQLNQQAEAVLGRWAALAERKAAAELHTRLHLWETFLAENEGRYATEVAQRVMIALLLRRFPAVSQTPEGQRLLVLDQGFHQRLRPGPFVWEPALSPAFPAEEFWYLYRLS